MTIHTYPEDTTTKDILRRLAALERAPRLQSASIGAGGLTVKADGAIRSGDFDGVDLDDPGTTGWFLGPDGLVVNRAVIRTGREVLIGHDDLDDQTAITTTESTLASTSIVIPDWADTAIVVAYGGASFFSAGANQVAVRVRIGGVSGDLYEASVDGDSRHVGAALAQSATPGATVQVDLQALKVNSSPDVFATSAAITAFGQAQD